MIESVFAAMSHMERDVSLDDLVKYFKRHHYHGTRRQIYSSLHYGRRQGFLHQTEDKRWRIVPYVRGCVAPAGVRYVDHD